MVPSNGLFELLVGDCDKLPHSTGWQNILLVDGQVLLRSTSDRACYFYIWRLPDAWLPFMTFCDPVPGWMVGRPDLAEAYLASCTVAMGWRLAVGIAQHLHRNMQLSAEGSMWPLPASAEHRCDHPFPITQHVGENASWELFVDNLDIIEVENAEAMCRLTGTDHEWMVMAKRNYELIGSPGDDSKDEHRVMNTTSRGIRQEGRLGVFLPPSSYLLELVGLTCWCLGHP